MAQSSDLQPGFKAERSKIQAKGAEKAPLF
jgi:hypothetical protein